MKLPDLPKVLKRKEADFITTTFNKWLVSNHRTCVCEVKHTKGKDYLNFNEVKPHQIENLLKVRHATFVYKIRDMGETTPFDLFCMHEMPAYVVIKYNKGFVGISIDNFVTESKCSKRRSLTWGRALEICVFSV